MSYQSSDNKKLGHVLIQLTTCPRLTIFIKRILLLVLTCPIIKNTAVKTITAKNSATKKYTEKVANNIIVKNTAVKNTVIESPLQVCFQCLLVSQASHHATAYFAYLYLLMDWVRWHWHSHWHRHQSL